MEEMGWYTEMGWNTTMDKGKEIMTPNPEHGKKRKHTRFPQSLEKFPSMRTYLYGMPNRGASSSESNAIFPNSGEISKSMKPVLEAKTSYFKKVLDETIFEINQDDYELANQPWDIKERYLGNATYPHNPSRHRMTCEVLLKKLKTVEIEHTRNSADPNGPIAYSKCFIRSILHQKDWGTSLFEEKIFKVGSQRISFNYWDYVQAMTNMFYLENPRRKHSWLIFILPEVAMKEIPSWFFSWWHKFGAELNILPKSILDKYDQWVESNSQINKYQLSDLIQGQCPLLFFIECKLPWIWTWSVEFGRDHLNCLCLQRTFFIKWWSGIKEKAKRAQIEAIISQNEEEMKCFSKKPRVSFL